MRLLALYMILASGSGVASTAAVLAIKAYVNDQNPIGFMNAAWAGLAIAFIAFLLIGITGPPARDTRATAYMGDSL